MSGDEKYSELTTLMMIYIRELEKATGRRTIELLEVIKNLEKERKEIVNKSHLHD